MEGSAIDEELLKILICPNCHGNVEYREAASMIACVGECRFEYPVVDGIPHMLVDEARKP
ncbi:MAG: Trm112 family protein [Actinomycetota bacterium]